MKPPPAKVGNDWYTIVELFTADGADESYPSDLKAPIAEVTVVATSETDPLKSFTAELPANWRQIPTDELSPLLSRALQLGA